MDYNFITRFLSDPTDARAIVLAVLATWSVSDAEHRNAVSFLTGVIGMALVLMLSPDPLLMRLGIGTAVWLVAPFVYKYGMRAAVHYMPWLGDKP